MKKYPGKNTFVVLSMLAASSLSAAAVTYDESVDGDMGWDQSFELGPNHNSITGSISTGSVSDSDGFYFTIPKNYKATFSFTSSIDTGASPYGVSFSWGLDRPIFSGDCSIVCLITYSPYASQAFKSADDVGYGMPSEYFDLSSISSVHELAAGTYRLSTIGSTSSLIPYGGEPWSNYLYSMSYTAAFDVQPVPLPNTLYLMATALMTLAGMRRKTAIR